MAVLARRAPIIAACAVVVPAVVYILVASQPKEHRAAVLVQPAPLVPPDVIVSSQVPSGWFLSPSADFVALLANTPPVRIEAARLLNRSPVELGKVSTTAHRRTGWVTVAVTARSSPVAIASANAFATAIGENLQLRTRNAIAILRGNLQQQLGKARDLAERGQIRAQLAAFRAFRPKDSEPIQVIAPAVAATPVSNRPALAAAAALILALFGGWRLARLVERADDRIHDPEEIEAVVGTPLLTAIQGSGNTSPEPFLRLRDSIVHLGGQDRHATLVVTSARAGEGRTSVAIGLAKAYTAAGRNVVLVDADLRDPQVAELLSVAARPGLADVLAGGSLSSALRAGRHPGLSVLPAAVPEHDASDLVGSERMRLVCQELAARFDVVIVDTPPLLAASDALGLVQEASGVVLVVRMDHTSRRALQRSAQILGRAGANVLGPVATGVQVTGPGLPSVLSDLPRRRLVAHAPGG